MEWILQQCHNLGLFGLIVYCMGLELGSMTSGFFQLDEDDGLDRDGMHYPRQWRLRDTHGKGTSSIYSVAMDCRLSIMGYSDQDLIAEASAECMAT